MTLWQRFKAWFFGDEGYSETITFVSGAKIRRIVRVNGNTIETRTILTTDAELGQVMDTALVHLGKCALQDVFNSIKEKGDGRG